MKAQQGLVGADRVQFGQDIGYGQLAGYAEGFFGYFVKQGQISAGVLSVGFVGSIFQAGFIVSVTRSITHAINGVVAFGIGGVSGVRAAQADQDNRNGKYTGTGLYGNHYLLYFILTGSTDSYNHSARVAFLFAEAGPEKFHLIR